MDEREHGTSRLASFVVFLLGAAFIVLLALSLWPTRDSRTGTAMTDSSPRVERTPANSTPEAEKASPQK